MSTGVEVKKINNHFHPCTNCKYRNSLTNPATFVHSIQQQHKSFNLGFNNKTNWPYAQIVGICHDYKQK